MQESSYKLAAKGVRCGISLTTGEKDCVAVDFGIGQINDRTIRSFKFDQDKLLSDLTYSVEAAAIVLADFKRMYPNDSEFWTRYNAGVRNTPVVQKNRKIYKRLVARYM
jgi:hypothetical protein